MDLFDKYTVTTDPPPNLFETNGPTSLKQADATKVLNALPGFVTRLIESGFYLAGGSIRAIINNEAVADYDMFGQTDEQIVQAAMALSNQYGAKLVKTLNAITVRIDGFPPVQFILPWKFTSPQACMNNFDFTICRAVLFADTATRSGDPIEPPDFDTACDRRFYHDTAEKILWYCQPQREEDSAGSFLRVQKFIARGYKIAPLQLAKLLGRVVAGSIIPPRRHKAWEVEENERYERDCVEAIHETFKASSKRRMGY
jgi:hypothetical protein